MQKEKEKSFVNKRLTALNKSLFNPDYILVKYFFSFINSYANKKWESILDYGSGNSPYKDYFMFEKYIAADVSQNINNDIDILIKDEKLHGLQDESVSLVLCFDVLEHCYSTSKTLSEMYRVMQQGATLLISVPFIYRQHEMPEDYYRFTSAAILKKLQDVGFHEIKIKKYGNKYFTIMSLWYESLINDDEEISGNIFQKISRYIFRIFMLPILNLTIFSSAVKQDETVFHHLFIRAEK